MQAEISGVDPDNVCFVTVFAGRVWMVERDTASAWYLPAGQIAGVASEFPMGLKFAHGGNLLALFDWSYDGGSGLSSSLVALSTNGDVLVYQGTDPDTADTFGLKGVWYAGPPLAGREVASTFGGDMLLLTRQGLVPMSKLVVGLPDVRAESLTVKVSSLFNALTSTRGAYRGWAVVQHPEDPPCSCRRRGAGRMRRFNSSSPMSPRAGSSTAGWRWRAPRCMTSSSTTARWMGGCA